MRSRWEKLLDSKPIEIAEHLREEVSKLLAQELLRWPLGIEDLDPAFAVRFGPVLEAGAPRPESRVFAEAFKLTRWELAREVEAIDDYMRNQRFLEQGLAPAEKLSLIFVSRWMLEQLLSLNEATQGRVTRANLSDCLNRIERKVMSGDVSPD